MYDGVLPSFWAAAESILRNCPVAVNLAFASWGVSTRKGMNSNRSIPRKVSAEILVHMRSLDPGIPPPITVNGKKAHGKDHIIVWLKINRFPVHNF